MSRKKKIGSKGLVFLLISKIVGPKLVNKIPVPNKTVFILSTKISVPTYFVFSLSEKKNQVAVRATGLVNINVKMIALTGC